MNILIISSSAIPTPPLDYAGLERVCASFAKTAAEKGHEITLVSSKGSAWAHIDVHPNLTVLETIHPSWDGNTELEHWKLYKDLVLSEYVDNDTIVWDNTWLAYIYKTIYEEKKKCNIVHTHHGNLVFRTPPPLVVHPGFVGLSAAHSMYMSNTLGVPVRTVHNGIDLPEWTGKNPDEGYLLSLNRMSKEKGIHNTIDLAVRNKKKILICGDDTHVQDPTYVQRIYERCRDSGGYAEYYGLIDEETKKDLLKHCTAVVGCPEPSWIEAFGLYVVEAMAYGKPVLGTTNGGLMDIIQHGVNGFLASTPEKLSDGISRLHEIDPENCRKRAEEFSSSVMVDNYLALFNGIIQDKNRW